MESEQLSIETQLTPQAHGLMSSISQLTKPLERTKISATLGGRLSSMSIRRPDLYQVEQSYSTDTSDVVVNPRRQHIKLDKADYISFPELNSLDDWLYNNVVNYVTNESRWSSRVCPERVLYLYSTKGTGRLTTTTVACSRNRINLLYIKSSYREQDYLFSIYKHAVTIQPCIVYFDDAAHILREDRQLNAIYASMRTHLNEKLDNVWTIFASTTSPTVLSDRAQCLISEYGSIVYIPVMSDKPTLKRFILMMLQDMSGDFSYPFDSRSSADSPWNLIIDNFVNYSEFCTLREIELFIARLFRKEYQGLTEIGETPKPSPKDVQYAFEQLPYRADMTMMRTLSTRQVKQDFEDHNIIWKKHLQMTGVDDKRSQERIRRRQMAHDADLRFNTMTPSMAMYSPSRSQPYSPTSPAHDTFDRGPTTSPSPMYSPVEHPPTHVFSLTCSSSSSSFSSSSSSSSSSIPALISQRQKKQPPLPATLPTKTVKLPNLPLPPKQTLPTEPPKQTLPTEPPKQTLPTPPSTSTSKYQPLGKKHMVKRQRNE